VEDAGWAHKVPVEILDVELLSDDARGLSHSSMGIVPTVLGPAAPQYQLALIIVSNIFFIINSLFPLFATRWSLILTALECFQIIGSADIGDSHFSLYRIVTDTGLVRSLSMFLSIVTSHYADKTGTNLNRSRPAQSKVRHYEAPTTS